jgi:hypothetical protein
VRQQWRECCSEATAKRGAARQALGVETCWGPRWAWGGEQGEGPPWALALDATTLGPRFSGLALSGGYRGGANQAWRRQGLRMRRQGHRALPRPSTVMRLAERGLDAHRLFRRLRRRGGTRFGASPPAARSGLRARGAASLCRRGCPSRALPGRNRQRPWTLLACGEAGSTDPWGRLTDLPPEASPAWWEGWRAWMAQGVKSPRRAGWQGQRTPMPPPDRAARLGLAGAGATLGLLSVGGEAEATSPARTVLDVTALGPQPLRTREATRLRRGSGCRRGGTLIRVALLDHAPLPMGRVVPEPWPTIPVEEEAPPSWPERALPQAAGGRRPQARQGHA